MGPKTEKDLFPKDLKRSEELSAERCQESVQRPRGTVWMKKVRNIRWHTTF